MPMDEAPMTSVLLDAAAIARRVPHAGKMCLLNALHHWDELTIRCSAISHQTLDHPLRSASGLLSAAAIEYAAQAMALHGGLLAERDDPAAEPTPGFLASVRGVQLHLARLDTLTMPLMVEATRMLAQDTTILYAFRVWTATLAVAEGRATVVLNTPLKP